jgi:hypothetical protein
MMAAWRRLDRAITFRQRTPDGAERDITQQHRAAEATTEDRLGRSLPSRASLQHMCQKPALSQTAVAWGGDGFGGTARHAPSRPLAARSWRHRELTRAARAERMRGVLLAASLAALTARCGGAFTCGPADDAATCGALGDLYAQGLQPWVAAASGGSGWAAAASGVPTPLCTFNGTTCDGAGRLISLCVAFPTLEVAAAATAHHAGGASANALPTWACGELLGLRWLLFALPCHELTRSRVSAPSRRRLQSASQRSRGGNTSGVAGQREHAATSVRPACGVNASSVRPLV